MPTRLYLHEADYNRSFFGGTYNQGSPSYVTYWGAFGGGRHVVGGNLLNYSTLVWANAAAGAIPKDFNPAATVNVETVYAVAYSPDLSLWAYNDGIGRIYTSPDANTWTLRFTDPQPGASMAYFNGYFLSGHSSGIMVISTDGINWARTTTNAGANAIQGIAYSPTLNRWIYSAQGGSGTIGYTSNPAVPWTTATSLGTGQNTNCLWSSSLNLFVIVGSVGKILTSPTALSGTWTQRTSGVTGTLWSCCGNADGSVLLAGGTGALLRSTDGINWSSILANAPDAINTTYSIWHDGTAFFATGGISIVMRSADNGDSWQIIGSELSTAIATATPGSYPIEANVLKIMNTTLGLAQATSEVDTADVATIQSQFLGMFGSQPLDSNQTVGGGTMILNTAQNASSAAAAFQMNAMNVYVWRPSTGEVVGYVRDAGGTQLANVPGGTGETVTHITGITTIAIAAKRGDIIVCEMWARFTQGMATSYVGRLFYDGTTVNTTQGAAVTNHASFVEFTENLTFSATPVSPSNPSVWVFTT